MKLDIIGWMNIDNLFKMGLITYISSVVFIILAITMGMNEDYKGAFLYLFASVFFGVFTHIIFKAYKVRENGD